MGYHGLGLGAKLAGRLRQKNPLPLPREGVNWSSTTANRSRRQHWSPFAHHEDLSTHDSEAAAPVSIGKRGNQVLLFHAFQLKIL